MVICRLGQRLNYGSNPSCLTSLCLAVSKQISLQVRHLVRLSENRSPASGQQLSRIIVSASHFNKNIENRIVVCVVRVVRWYSQNISVFIFGLIVVWVFFHKLFFAILKYLCILGFFLFSRFRDFHDFRGFRDFQKSAPLAAFLNPPNNYPLLKYLFDEY